MTYHDRPIGEDLRDIRRSLHMSLSTVERKSNGVWLPSVVGSYERDQRRPSVDKARALLDWYGGYRLAVLQPGDLVHSGRIDQNAGVRYSVVCNGLTIPADDRGHAERIAATMTGARVGYQLIGAMSYLDGSP